MSKKIIIFLVVILLLVIAGGVFWWWEKNIERKEFEKYKQEMEMIYASPKDYVIRETEEGKLIENEKDGLKVEVPRGWIVEKTTELLEFGGEKIKLLNPEFTSETQPSEMCMIEIMIVRQSEKLIMIRDANEIRDFIIECQKNPEKMKNFGYNESYEAIEVANRKALKRTYLVQSEEGLKIGKWITVEIPIENKIYSFNAFIVSQNLEKLKRCNQEFDKFLETVLIDID